MPYSRMEIKSSGDMFRILLMYVLYIKLIFRWNCFKLNVYWRTRPRLYHYYYHRRVQLFLLREFRCCSVIFLAIFTIRNALLLLHQTDPPPPSSPFSLRVQTKLWCVAIWCTEGKILINRSTHYWHVILSTLRQLSRNYIRSLVENGG